MPDDPSVYLAAGPGFAVPYACLHQAIALLRVHQTGAVYQRLWSWQTFAASPGLMAEVQCDCDTCWKERNT
jgi:hypothetical protein